MAAERKEQGTTRQSILQLLRRNRQMTALELSRSLHIGAVGIRQHLALLERDDLVAVEGLRRGVGRPSHLYVLTAQAEAYFPKYYDQIALDVLDYVADQGGTEAVDGFFDVRRQKIAQTVLPNLAGKSRAERVATLAAILAEQGYMCEHEQLDDGSFVLREHNCPIDCVARQYPQACAHEIALYEELLGVPVERDTTIAQGASCCCYRIPA